MKAWYLGLSKNIRYVNMVKVGIIGLGLMGGSLDLALKDLKLVKKVLGCDKIQQNE